MKNKIKGQKDSFRQHQKSITVEEKIKQLYLMQKRYLQISKSAIAQNLKKSTAEYERACRLTGEENI